MRSQRLALASGALYVLAIMIGNSMYEAGKTGADDGAGALADLQRTTSPVQTVGLTLEILGFTAFLVFLGADGRTVRATRFIFEGPGRSKVDIRCATGESTQVCVDAVLPMFRSLLQEFHGERSRP